MMIIETFLKETTNKGIGLFTKKFIKKGDIVYQDEDLFSKSIPNKILETLPEIQIKFIKTYSSYIEAENIWYLCLDNARFFNHSETPNTKYLIDETGNGYCIALNNINSDEELTSDYREFDDNFKKGNFDFEIK